MGEDVEVVEFGAGASQKVRILLDTGRVARLFTAGYFRRLSA